MAKKSLYDHIEQLIKLERESAEQNTLLLQEMIAHDEQNIQVLDRVADRLMDSMYGITGEGEKAYRLYLDYIETFNPSEAKERKEDLEYDLGYKTHILYAAAILCRKELEGFHSADGKSSFDVVMQDYIPKVNDVKKKTASFLFFAHYANGRPIDDLMRMLQTITEETDYVLSHIEEFEELMYYPRETYHPLREDEWQLIKYIVVHNIEAYNTHLEQNKDFFRKMPNGVFSGFRPRTDVFEHIPESLVAVVGYPHREEGSSKPYTEIYLMCQPVDTNLPTTYQELNRAEVLEFLRQNKGQNRFVPDWIETNDSEKLSKLTEIIQTWMKNKVPQQATSAILQLAQARKTIAKPTVKEKNAQLLEEKFKLENFDLIVWEYISK